MSSARQMPPMDPARRMLIARARDREQVRNQVVSAEPGLSEEEIEQRVEAVFFARRSSGGRKSAANRAVEREIVRQILAVLPAIVADAESNLHQLRTLATLAEDVA